MSWGFPEKVKLGSWSWEPLRDERCSKEISATRGGGHSEVCTKKRWTPIHRINVVGVRRQVMKTVRFITQITGYTTGTTLRSLRFHSSKGRISADYGCQAREFTEFILSSVLRMAKANPTFLHN